MGKTTLLKHMANFSIEGFPRHHRIMHVKQEVAPSEDSVLSVVLTADIERTELLRQEASLLAQMELTRNAVGNKEENLNIIQHLEGDLNELYLKMEQMGTQHAAVRVAAILTGLQFTTEMQQSSTSSLSGGWRMRVSLAAALFIEP